MAYLTHKTVKRLSSRLKHIAWEELDPDFRLNFAQKAIAEGFGFQHLHALQSALPTDARWDGRACAEFLSGNGYVPDDGTARHLVGWLEDELPQLLFDRSPQPVDLDAQRSR